jgi:hypothetical protein
MKSVLLLSLACVITLPVYAALPGDSAQGKKLHDANCLKCHDASVYTRKERNIQSLDALHSQIGSCSHAAQVKLTEAEQKSLVKYLNEQYYKFK